MVLQQQQQHKYYNNEIQQNKQTNTIVGVPSEK